MKSSRRLNVELSVDYYDRRIGNRWEELRGRYRGLRRGLSSAELLTEEGVAGLSDGEAALFAGIGRQSLHFLSMFVLGYDRLTPPTGSHGELCKVLQQDFDKPTFLMGHRSFFKSTIGAICRPLFGVVNDPWRYDHIHVVDDQALGLRQLNAVAGHISGDNPRFNRLYPEIQPKKGEWSPRQDGTCTVSLRPSTQTGCTFELRTTRQGMAGRHVRDFTLDDWVTETNCDSSFEQERLWEKFVKQWPSIDTDNLLICGTPYTNYDCWTRVLKYYYPDELRVLLYPIRGTAHIDEECRVRFTDTPHGEPHRYANPFEWDDRRYDREKRKMSPFPAFFELQYHLATLLDWGGGFSGVVFQYALAGLLNRDELCFYTASDPASGEADSQPATVIWAVAPDGQQVVWDARTYEEETEMIDDLFPIFREYSPVMMGVERMGHGGWSTCREIERRCEEERCWLPIEPLTPKGEAKDSRILATLRPKYRRGIVWHHPDLRDGEYERQIAEFGKYKDKDLADASAYCSQLCDFYGYQFTGPELNERREAVHTAAGRYANVGLTTEQMFDPENDGWEELELVGAAGRRSAGSIL